MSYTIRCLREIHVCPDTVFASFDAALSYFYKSQEAATVDRISVFQASSCCQIHGVANV